MPYAAFGAWAPKTNTKTAFSNSVGFSARAIHAPMSSSVEAHAAGICALLWGGRLARKAVRFSAARANDLWFFR